MPKFIHAFLIILLLLAGSSFAQDREALGSRFFRVTITANEKPLLAESIFEDTSGSLIVKGAPLSMVMARAYGLEPYQFMDAPEWVYEAHLYDIEAVPPPAQLVTADETEALQALLAERFGLEIRRERREVTMAVLDVDRAKQDELEREAQAHREAGRELTPPPRPPDGRPPTEAEIARANAYFRSLGYRPVTTKALLREFSARLGEPILDLTLMESVHVSGARVQFRASDASTLNDASTELAQWGLILARRTVPLEVIVVTAIERPVLDASGR